MKNEGRNVWLLQRQAARFLFFSSRHASLVFIARQQSRKIV
jgi:hypothetical protein